MIRSFLVRELFDIDSNDNLRPPVTEEIPRLVENSVVGQFEFYPS